MNVIIIDCFDTWEHRANYIYRVLKEEENDVHILMSEYSHSEKNKRKTKEKDHIFFKTLKYKKNISVSRLLSHMLLSWDIFRYVESQSGRVDLLWVMAPPNSFVKDAIKAKRNNPKLKIIIDVIDMWPETMPIRTTGSFLRPWRNLRDKWLRHADYVVTECYLFQEKLSKVVERNKISTIYLTRENLGYNPMLQLPEDKIALCYLGSINNIIDISVICDIIRQSSKIKKVILHIIGDGEKRDEMISLCKDAGAEVIYHGKIYDRTQKQKIMDSCHWGLNIMKPTVFVGLTMKSVDFFEFGLPVINNIKGDTWQAVSKFSLGENYSGLGQDMNVLDMLGNNHTQRLAARRFFERYLSGEAFSEKVRKVVKGCLQ